MAAVAFDSNVFIYWLERNPEFFDTSTKLVTRVHQGHDTAHCSTLIYTEIYRGSPRVLEALSEIQNLSFLPMNESIAKLAGQLRHTYAIKAPDAIHIATALAAGAEKLVTNDVALVKLDIPGIQIEPLQQSV